MSKGLYEIIGELEVNGYSIFELEEEIMNCEELRSLQDLEDGFHINNEQHMALFEKSRILQNIEVSIKALYAQKYKNWNKIFVTRCVETLSNEKYRTHYDSHLYTIVIPVLMPKDSISDRGQLYLVPKLRALPSNDIVNIFGKIDALKFRGEKNYERVKNLKTFTELDLSIGQALIFKGITCLHGNKLNASPEKRVTAITHFGDPFKYGIGSWMRNIRSALNLRK